MADDGMKKIRTVIVDDEPPARSRLRELLEREADIDVIAECANGPEAIMVLQEQLPDLLLLDVQMPEMDGFEVLHAAGVDLVPAIVFVTAWDEHARRAFDVHAVDYVLKPVDAARFAQAVARARARLRNAPIGNAVQLRNLLEQLRGPAPWLERLAVRESGRIGLLPVDRIQWVESADNYVRVHTADSSCHVRMTLKELENRLDPQRFVRVHRSALVAIDRIHHLEPWSHGDYRIVLHDGTRLMASRTYVSNLRRLVGQTL
jgi:two-component system LytT family response regulator